MTTMDKALQAMDEGFRIVAEAINHEMKRGGASPAARIVADPPPPGVSMDDCRKVIRIALGKQVDDYLDESDASRIFPWIIGHVARDASEQVVGIPLRNSSGLNWDDVLSSICARLGEVAHHQGREAIDAWCRANIIEPVTKYHAENREKLAAALATVPTGREVDRNEENLAIIFAIFPQGYLASAKTDIQKLAYESAVRWIWQNPAFPRKKLKPIAKEVAEEHDENGGSVYAQIKDYESQQLIVLPDIE
jgi:hypothetical protein